MFLQLCSDVEISYILRRRIKYVIAQPVKEPRPFLWVAIPQSWRWFCHHHHFEAMTSLIFWRRGIIYANVGCSTFAAVFVGETFKVLRLFFLWKFDIPKLKRKTYLRNSKVMLLLFGNYVNFDGNIVRDHEAPDQMMLHFGEVMILFPRFEIINLICLHPNRRTLSIGSSLISKSGNNVWHNSTFILMGVVYLGMLCPRHQNVE